MHFSIPDTQEVKNESGSSYIAYNVHVNGAFHCTVRYRQLHNLHDQLRREFGPNSLPTFPPKKLLPLTPTQTEERRVLLEKYIQLVSQDSRIVNSEIFSGFLLNAQQETQNVKEEFVSLDVYMMNWQKITVQISSFDRTSVVLESICKSMNLNEELIPYFCLYLIVKEQNLISVEKRLQDFEAPYLSLRSAANNSFLVIRKSYWDSSYDEDLLNNKIALNLLYIQAISDVEQGWTKTDKETQRQLASLQAKGSKQEYLMLVRTLQFYGHLRFRPCICDYPKKDTSVTIYAGGKDLIFRFNSAKDGEKEISFRVTRIKCWRITTSIADHSDNNSSTVSSLSAKLRLELSFQYLLGKDDLKWICIISDQAILMSVCLQGMVDELLLKRKGGQFLKKNQKMSRRGSWNYMKRDGSSHQISSVCRSVSHDAIAHSTKREENSYVANRSKGQVRRITEKLAGVSVKYANKNDGVNSSKELVENSAFDGIGDDDL